MWLSGRLLQHTAMPTCLMLKQALQQQSLQLHVHTALLCRTGLGASSSRSTSTSSSSSTGSSGGAGSQQPQQSQPDHAVYVLPMPSLSHNMTSGRITRWLKSPGDQVRTYDILAEVTTGNLVDEAYKVDDFAGDVTLLLESQEEAFLAQVLVPEGQEVQIGTPIAVLSEAEEEAAAAAAAGQHLQGLNVYDEGALQQGRQGLGFKVQLLEWQSYLKESNKGPAGSGGSSSCGCM